MTQCIIPRLYSNWFSGFNSQHCLAMTLDFDQLLGERTKEGEAAVHGVLMKCVDKDGPGAPPLPSLVLQ